MNLSTLNIILTLFDKYNKNSEFKYVLYNILIMTNFNIKC